MAGEKLRQGAMKERVTRFDEEYQAVIALHQSKVKYYERQPASRSSLVLSQGT